MPGENPLLRIQFDVPFDRIRPEHVEPAVRQLLDLSRAAIEAIAGTPGERTWENTMGALEKATETLEFAMTVVGHLESVMSSDALRAAYNAVQPDVSAFFAGIPLHEGLWRALQRYAATDEAKGMQGAHRRLLDKTLDEFRRHGADLDAAGKQRLEAITRELAQLTSRFGQNVLDATAAWERYVDDEAKLAGLPDSAKAAARADAESRGRIGWRFTLHAPSYVPVMTYLDDAGLREEVWRAYDQRAATGEKDNRPLIRRILELRREKANLLGFRDFADFVLADRMAKTGKAALDFVHDLRERTEPWFQAENDRLLAFRREIEGDGAPQLQPWDIAYYAEKQRHARFDFDEEELRPYFPADRVVAGLFEIVQRLYGIRIVERKDVPVWHPSVHAFEIHDKGGNRVAAFYADLYPRDVKRGGAWMNGLISGVPGEDGPQPHLGLICANFNPAVGHKPALLTHREVETLFHEFGHLLHHVLSEVELRSLAGTNVAWDFVELPSQIMENWCWEREALDLFAGHFETGEKIPQDLFEKLLRTRTYRAANAMMRQLGFAGLDLALHVHWDPAGGADPVAMAQEILQEHTPAQLPAGSAFVTSFTHLFSSATGYAAGYYSYKWAEVLDADAFSRFREEGIFNPDVGLAFREAILSRGDSRDPAELFRDFMGREPSLDALLQRAGLVGAPA
ncbi:M3 family metallopeptidase [Vulgatibacter sp.]|uniref:M3 family metallopeptidase n=1 Tax=Vulgatibacter sp. TaxID=1971226 RepID=UPI0035646E5E